MSKFKKYVGITIDNSTVIGLYKELDWETMKRFPAFTVQYTYKGKTRQYGIDAELFVSKHFA